MYCIKCRFAMHLYQEVASGPRSTANRPPKENTTSIVLDRYLSGFWFNASPKSPQMSIPEDFYSSPMGIPGETTILTPP
jgi:hypothetical protein